MGYCYPVFWEITERLWQFILETGGSYESSRSAAEEVARGRFLA